MGHCDSVLQFATVVVWVLVGVSTSTIECWLFFRRLDSIVVVLCLVLDCEVTRKKKNIIRLVRNLLNRWIVCLSVDF